MQTLLTPDFNSTRRHFGTLQELKYTAIGTLPQLALPQGHVNSSAGKVTAEKLHLRSESCQSHNHRLCCGKPSWQSVERCTM